ncbi:MAG: hypothetical protein ACTMHG_03590 [Marinobacter sp.]
MKKSIALATLVLLLFVGIVFQYYITALPDLEQPVTLREASTTTEAGSVVATFVDNAGDPFTFGFRASEDFEPEVYPVFYMRNPELVPYMYWTNIGGPDERALLRVVEGWLQRNVAPELMERLEQGHAEDLSVEEQKIAAVYEVYALLRERHQG